uniref:Uncharacterized protein n=1 Tax=uncultured marine virus TaxID=186617 RepID=A0A0F7L2Z5_9VIRU|nr:hypothetical protein [uncultured marine virus]
MIVTESPTRSGFGSGAASVTTGIASAEGCKGISTSMGLQARHWAFLGSSAEQPAHSR